MRTVVFVFAVACTGDPDTDDTDTHPGDTDAGPDDTDTGVADTDTDPGDTDTDVGDTDVGDDCTPSTVFPAHDGDADFVLEGTADLALTGTAVLLSDLDGDGTDDLLIGAPDADAGRVWLAYGPLSTDGTLDTVADAWFDGEGVNDDLGRQLGALGDFDGDGLDDVAALASGWPVPGDDDGRAYLTFGSTTRHAGAVLISTWEASVSGQSVGFGSELGNGITGIGDVDGDGFDDVAFANPYPNSEAGRVYVLSGRATRPVGDLNEDSMPSIGGKVDDMVCFGRCLAGDDFDGDGFADLAIASDGYQFHTNRVWMRYGDGTFPDDERVDDHPALEGAPDSNELQFGTETAAVGDLDGDGYPELAVSDPWDETAVDLGGRVWVFRGGPVRWTTAPLDSTAWLTIEGVEEVGHLGSALVGLGDVDCDGKGDLAIGAAYADGLQSSSGVVGLWLGPSGGLDRMSDATATIQGGVSDAGFGQALAHGDVDGDGEPDLVVGSPDYGNAKGRVYVFLDAF